MGLCAPHAVSDFLASHTRPSKPRRQVVGKDMALWYEQLADRLELQLSRAGAPAVGFPDLGDPHPLGLPAALARALSLKREMLAELQAAYAVNDRRRLGALVNLRVRVWERGGGLRLSCGCSRQLPPQRRAVGGSADGLPRGGWVWVHWKARGGTTPRRSPERGRVELQAAYAVNDWRRLGALVNLCVWEGEQGGDGE
jgi:hypothetical protein